MVSVCVGSHCTAASRHWEESRGRAVGGWFRTLSRLSASGRCRAYSRPRAHDCYLIWKTGLCRCH